MDVGTFDFLSLAFLVETSAIFPHPGVETRGRDPVKVTTGKVWDERPCLVSWIRRRMGPEMGARLYGSSTAASDLSVFSFFFSFD